MQRLLPFWDSTLGKKVVMAVTGLIMIGFLVAHLLGNLQIFYPDADEKLRHYALFLRSLGGLLWLARAVLLVSLVLHVVAALQLTLRDRAARPVAYTRQVHQAATAGSRSLRIGGIVLLAFIVYHLLHFTFGTVHPDFRDIEPYHNMVAGFRDHPVVVLFYLLAMGSVGLHVYHGAWSSFRSLGAADRKANPLERPIARVLAVALALGFAAIPIAVLMGWVG
jgi:succinate dehydrogenase cytochrome b subunit